MADIDIIRARSEDAGILTEVAVAAKGHWGYPAHWMAEWRTHFTVVPSYVVDSEVYTAVDPSGELIGWYGLVGNGRRLLLDELWVRPDHIGSGIGRALFNHALARAAALGAEEIELESDPNAAGFYERMGARQVGQRPAAPIDGVERYLPKFVMPVPNVVEDDPGSSSPVEKVNLAQKFSLFSEHWSPKLVAELNGQQVKLVKFQGPFVWHQHENEDELFLVVNGRFRIEFRDYHVWLEEGEFLVVPRGVEHRPVAEEEVHVLLFEPASTLNTGNTEGALTVSEIERL